MIKFKKSIENNWLQSISKDVVSFFYRPKEAVKGAKFVFVWDLDKTYLDTHFESLAGLYKTIFEKGFEKRNVPGTATLIKALSKKNSPLPLFFISASPPQMHERIRQKWEVDEIEPFGFFSKDNLKNLKFSRWSRLTNHIGFKLQSLMELRLLLSEDVQMICWGDDSEADATIYSLFSDICSYRLTDREVKQTLEKFKVPEDQVELIIELRDQKEEFDPLSRVYINLAVDTDPEYYRRYGRRLMAIENSFEIGLDLFQRGFITSDSVVAIGEDLIKNYKFKRHQLEESYTLLCKRNRLAKQADEVLRGLLVKKNLLGKSFELEIELPEVERMPFQNDFENMARPWIPERVDYLSEY